MKAASQVAGMDSAEEYLQARVDENQEASAVPLDGFLDKLIFASGQVTVPVLGAVGSAVLAPYVGMTAAGGATLSGVLASLGMTAGDLQSKAEELDPAHRATAEQLLTSGVIAMPDAFLLGKAKVVLSPIRELIEQSVKGTLKASRGMAALGETAVTAAGIGVAEGLQDAGTGLGANYFTGTQIDEQRIRALADSAVEEALIGGILGVPLGAASTATGRLAEAQIAFDENRKLSLDAKGENSVLGPVEGAVKQAGLFTLGANLTFGNATDYLKQSYADNPFIQGLGQAFNLRPIERHAGKFTINEKAQGQKAAFEQMAKPFRMASASQQLEAVQAKARGELDMTNPVHASLAEVLNKGIPQAYAKIGGEMTGLFTEETYLPWNMDWEAVNNDPNIRVKAREDLEKQGLEESVIKKTLARLDARAKSWKEHGNDLHYSKQSATNRVESYLAGVLQNEEVYDTPKRVKGLIKKISAERKQEKRESPLTLERELGAFSEEFLNKYRNKKIGPQEMIDSHMHKAAEHLALMEVFGTDLEKFDEQVGRAIAWGKTNNKPIKPRDIERMYDVLRTQQRIHLKPVGETQRKIQRNTKAILNTQLLGLSALVSIPESIFIFLNAGSKSALKSLAATLNPLNTSKIAADDVGLSLTQAVNHVINRTGEESFEIGKWEETFFKFTGLPQLQHFLTIWSARAFDTNIRSLLADYTKSDLSDQGRTHILLKLDQAGIDVEEALQWRKTGFDINNPYFTEKYLPALFGLTRDTIVDPHPVDKSLWMNDERFTLISHLKGFMTTFTNRVMRGWKDKMALQGPGANRELATRLAPYVALYLAGQIGVQMARELIKTGDTEKFDEKSLSQMIWDAFGYLGSMAYFVDLVNAVAHRSDPLASAGGPAISKALDVTRSLSMGVIEQNPEAALEGIIETAMPNVPGIGVVQELVEDAFNGSRL
jgi:hypothetical protein